MLVLVASISLVTAAVQPAEAGAHPWLVAVSAPRVTTPATPPPTLRAPTAAPTTPAPVKPSPVKGDPAQGANAHGVGPATTAPVPPQTPVTPVDPTAPAPAPNQPGAPAAPPAPPAPPAAPPAPTGYSCAAALAYLNANAAPGFIHECPGYAYGNSAMTCVNHAPECPGQKIIAISVPCPAAYMNEASNSWVLTGLKNGSLDPYGSC